MKKKKIYLGSFVRLKQPSYLRGVVEETISYNGNSFMFFLGSPQRFQVVDKNKLDIKIFETLLKKYQINRNNVFVHLPYLINLANYNNPRVLHNSKQLMKANLKLCEYLQIKRVILHPGCALKNNRRFCLQKITEHLDEILEEFPSIIVCLETMSGKGSELGRNFDELKIIIEKSKHPKQIAVCFDLCHLYSAGYDLIKNWEGILKEFDEKIGLDKLLVCHINDSKTPFYSQKDRHANIGKGQIGLQPIQKIIHDSKMEGKTMILETPYIDEQPPYKEEISLLLNLDNEK